MNRIILIGNGYDLAKGLKSGYNDFINWLWKNIIENFKLSNVRPYEDDFVQMDSPFNLKERSDIYDYQTFEKFHSQSRETIKFKNEFLRSITKKTFSNWVDIEEEYFNELKDILKSESRRENENNIKKLNSDFERIKSELKKYLNNELKEFEQIRFNYENLSESFNLLDFTNKGVEELEKEFFSKTDDDKQKQYFTEKIKRIKSGDYYDCKTSIYPETVLFLNFNYTNFIPQLIYTIHKNSWQLDDWSKSRMENIYIHGELNNDKEPIIFGYGDENDELHKEIEKAGGDYLDNIKTINYLKTPNYKNLLNYIESNVFQVFILGHSCGLSDKTLLKTIFENENCLSIKPFYYINENGYNNYEDIVKNIYRTFSSKALMRDKVVNLKYCNKINV